MLRLKKPGRQRELLFAHQHFHYLVTVAAQQLFHCYGLGQMPAAFSLTIKKDISLGRLDDLQINVETHAAHDVAFS